LDSAWPNSVIANVASSQNAAAGNNSVLWDGRDNNGNQLPAGSYVAEVAAIDSVNGGYFSVDRAQFTVTSGGSVTPNPTELIRNLTAQSPIVRSQSSSIAFTLDQSATVTAYIRQGNSSLGSVVRTLNNSNMSSGNKNLLWDSRNDSGNLVSSGDYTLEIFTTNSSGQRSTSQTRLIRVQDQSVNPPYNGNFTLNSFSATSSFNPYRSNQKASISFSANRGYSDLADFNLEIFALNGNQFVKRLADLRSVSANGSYTYTWDGTDSRGAFVPCGTYYVYLKAQSGNESFADSRTIQVCDDYIGPNYPQPLPPVPLPIRKDDLCAGFIDVARASKDCSIIAFVHDMGVFEGYADGSFRPNQPINRAELTKVVLLSFGYKIANYNGSYLFSDIDPRSWYAPYLNTALNEGIITGYPNGTFAPEKTISRAEMLKVFFAASPDQSVSFCQFQPFADTPVEPATFWFVHYVCQAKSMGILPELNNYFYPHDAMTRLDAARLFYHYAQAKN
jgi:flagellar hook assembly protein FlgD